MCDGCDRPVVEPGNELFLMVYEPLFQCRSYETGDFHFEVFARALEQEGIEGEDYLSCVRKCVAVESVVREVVHSKNENLTQRREGAKKH